MTYGGPIVALPTNDCDPSSALRSLFVLGEKAASFMIVRSRRDRAWRGQMIRNFQFARFRYCVEFLLFLLHLSTPQFSFGPGKYARLGADGLAVVLLNVGVEIFLDHYCVANTHHAEEHFRVERQPLLRRGIPIVESIPLAEVGRSVHIRYVNSPQEKLPEGMERLGRDTSVIIRRICRAIPFLSRAIGITSTRSGLFHRGPKRHSIHRAALEAHHVLRQRARFIREDVFDLPEIRYCRAPGKGRGVSLLMVHVPVPTNAKHHEKGAHLDCHIKTERNKIVEQRDEEEDLLDVIRGLLVPIRRSNRVRKVWPLGPLLVVANVPKVVVIGSVGVD
mmetsp:Transcript_50514/g.152165  ORF Transcript_50514/g.152165 Transcript_50514/m.152165 type:complete len:334 (-) Transcript_50514:1624-2625(-)